MLDEDAAHALTFGDRHAEPFLERVEILGVIQPEVQAKELAAALIEVGIDADELGHERT